MSESRDFMVAIRSTLTACESFVTRMDLPRAQAAHASEGVRRLRAALESFREAFEVDRG